MPLTKLFSLLPAKTHSYLLNQYGPLINDALAGMLGVIGEEVGGGHTPVDVHTPRNLCTVPKPLPVQLLQPDHERICLHVPPAAPAS